MQTFPAKETPTTIPGPVGDLEALVVAPENHAEVKAIGIVCHPHSLYGGTLNNKVVTTVARTFLKLGLPVVRFNFRGVGKSAGSYDAGNGETQDLLAVYDWAQKIYPHAAVWLAGFSFGSFVALKASLQRKIEKLILIAPPVINFDFAAVKKAQCKELIMIQGDQDEVVSAKAVYAWAKQISPQPHLIRLPTATHFFHGQLGVLQEELMKIL